MSDVRHVVDREAYKHFWRCWRLDYRYAVDAGLWERVTLATTHPDWPNYDDTEDPLLGLWRHFIAILDPEFINYAQWYFFTTPGELSKKQCIALKSYLKHKQIS